MMADTDNHPPDKQPPTHQADLAGEGAAAQGEGATAVAASGSGIRRRCPR